MDITFNIRYHNNSNSRNDPGGRNLLLAMDDYLPVFLTSIEIDYCTIIFIRSHRHPGNCLVETLFMQILAAGAVKDRIATPHKQSFFVALERSHKELSKRHSYASRNIEFENATTACRRLEQQPSVLQEPGQCRHSRKKNQ